MGYQNIDPGSFESRIEPPDMPAPLAQLLCLIAATVLADPRPDTDISDLFLKEIKTLSPARHVEEVPSEARMLLWFELNKAEIEKMLVCDQFKPWYYELLEQLTTFTEKPTVLRAMLRLTQSDRQPFLNGKALLTLALRYWGYR